MEKRKRGKPLGYRKPGRFDCIFRAKMTEIERDKAIIAAMYIGVNLSEEIRKLFIDIIKQADEKALNEKI